MTVLISDGVPILPVSLFGKGNHEGVLVAKDQWNS